MNEYKRSRTEITIETHRVTTIRTRSVSRAVVQCDRCGQEVAPVDDTPAMAVTGGEPNNIVEMCRDGKMHRLLDSDIDGNSIALQLEEKK